MKNYDFLDHPWHPQGGPNEAFFTNPITCMKKVSGVILNLLLLKIIAHRGLSFYTR